MHRFYFPDLPDHPERVTLCGGEALHAIKVLRIQPGEHVTLLDGKGRRARANVIDLRKKELGLEIERLDQTGPANVFATLFQSVTKTKSMDWIIEKATELGVHAVQPVTTERSISRPDESDGARKTEKWRRIATESLKQCGGLWLPRIYPVQTLDRTIEDSATFQFRFFASLSSEALELRQVLKVQGSSIGEIKRPLHFGVWIGPEGDFSPNEIQLLLDSKITPVTLGANVLRSETAAISALSLLNCELRQVVTNAV